ncbi:MBL fold metallo-hydrolase [Sphingobacterium sp. IITKGP-BTPF85]|uniref:MBL fold metallo-hydrolase n=1 Tax=Sphingobacterium sp. IITKGP-BTPF85 TaxID=1338009 RepID=UPI000389DE58|nr:MBL fold metallo-hydrolase [Sphingobacterium sp. IITKGP-BTPF85]KKX48888.1 metallo-beta-lactamase [Sphingobacterium sp. IITKGP-BTPF85]
MLQIKTFTFNPYQENTYLIYDEQKNCVIIDPGMYGPADERTLTDFIEQNSLNPKILLNTHCHIDHVLGNRFIFDTYGLYPQFHEGELPVLIEVQNYAPQMGFRYDISPIGETFLTEENVIKIGDHELKIIFAPGHSPAHLCFYSEPQKFLIGGDVLFKNSIGRTDLPGGNHDLLLKNIKEKIYILPDEVTIYPGHGPTTTIGFEKATNPFIRG